MPGTMRVAQVTTGLETGGAETMLLRLVERLDRSRFEPVVLSLTHAGTLGARIAELGVEVIESHAASLPSPRDLWRVRRDIAALGADLVQTWALYGNVLGGVAARFAGRAPVVWGVHHSGDDLPGLGRKAVWTQGLERRLASVVPSRVIACSQSSLSMLNRLRYPERKLVTILNGFDLARFRPDPGARAEVRAELGIAEGDLVVGHVARFHPVKGHGVLLAAARSVLAADPRARFVLCGKGVEPGNPMLSRLAEPLGERLMLLGECARMERMYAAFDVCASSSSAEALPLAIGEAMASGAPVVATDVGDSAAMIGETGWIAAPGDADALARGIVELMALGEEERRALGTAARGRIERLYSLERMVAGYEELWSALAGAPEPPGR